MNLDDELKLLMEGKVMENHEEFYVLRFRKDEFNFWLNYLSTFVFGLYLGLMLRSKS